MKKIQMKKQNEDAVSPVIGVMLMLVVTIIIAAVVAAFASGLGGDVEAAPAAVLGIDAYADGKVKISALSGDNLVTKEITMKVQDLDGTQLAKGDLSSAYSGAYFTPGTTATIETGSTLPKGEYVTVIVIADGKHVVVNKEVMVKAA